MICILILFILYFFYNGNIVTIYIINKARAHVLKYLIISTVSLKYDFKICIKNLNILIGYGVNKNTIFISEIINLWCKKVKT